MLLVHDLMLLLTDDESGRVRTTSALTELLGGTLLVQLAADGIVDVTEDKPRSARLILPPDAPTSAEPLLAEAATVVAAFAGKKPDRALRALGKGVRERATGQTGPSIALLHASGELQKIIPVSDRTQAKSIAEKVSTGDWAAASVRRAVEAVQLAAIVAATTAATTAVTN